MDARHKPNISYLARLAYIVYTIHMTTLKVSITTPLIERATERDSRHCMIAEAILAARPDFRQVIVDLATIRWTNPRTKKRYIALTPERAAVALVAFDQGQEIEPFDLSLDPIQTTPVESKKRESVAEAQAAGRTIATRKTISLNAQGSRVMKVDAEGRPKIEGGAVLPTGHLSNRALSGRRYRSYGRRLLAP